MGAKLMFDDGRVRELSKEELARVQLVLERGEIAKIQSELLLALLDMFDDEPPYESSKFVGAKLVFDNGRVQKLTDTQLSRIQEVLQKPIIPESSEELIDEFCGMFADENDDFTAWYLAEKAKEKALEESKYDRSAKH